MIDLPFGPPPANQEPTIPLRRKLQILWQRAMSKLVLQYGGVWRALQDDGAGSPLAHPYALTTGWTVLDGYTENRPYTPKGVEVDYTTGLVRLVEDGVYSVSFTLGFTATQSRYVDFGARIDGVDPAAPLFRQEVLSSKGITSLTYTTLLTQVGMPREIYLLVRGEIAMNMDFYFGGWVVARQDFITEGDQDQPAN